MKIWLLTDNKNKKAYGNSRIIEEGKKAGLSIKTVVIDNIELLISSDGAEHIFVKNKLVKLPEIVIPRVNVSYQMKSIMDFFENKGVPVINNNEARFLAKDKFLSLQRLALNNIPVPKTILLKGIPSISFIEEQLKYPIIIKKIEGAQGKGIIKVNNKEDLEDMIEMLEESFTTLNKNLILQEYIGEKAGQDLRVFIVGGRIIGSMLRKGKDGDFKSNYSGGGSVLAHTLTEKEEILSLEAANIIGLDIAGIDMLFDKDNGYKICEVNASPGFEGLEKATQSNIAGEIINYIIKRYDIKIKK